jgi:hypothetical protein
MSSFTRKVPVLLAAATILASLTMSAAAAPFCYSRMEGQGTGQGLFGAGSQNARAAAIADWENRVADRWGPRYANFDRARSVRLDCKKGAILKAKCVVTAMPCR